MSKKEIKELKDDIIYVIRCLYSDYYCCSFIPGHRSATLILYRHLAGVRLHIVLYDAGVTIITTYKNYEINHLMELFQYW